MTTQQLQAQQIQAMKSRDTVRPQVIRDIVSQIKNKEIAVGHTLAEDEITTVIQKIKKEVLESIESFTKGNRTDLVAEAKKQLEIVCSFLPPELTDEQLKEEITTILNTNSSIITQNPKAAIGLCMKQLGGKAESSHIMTALTKIQSS